MAVVIVLIALLVVAGAAGLIVWIRRAASSTRVIGAPAGDEHTAYFSGDVMSRHVITSGSLAVIEFFDWGVRVRGNPVSRWIVPRWEARYEELAIAELVTLPHSRIAVWLRLRDGQGGIGFIRMPTTDALSQLEKHGVPIDRSVAQFRRVAELYQQP